MSEANLYDRIVTFEQVERAVVATLDLWIDGYLGELERIEGYASGEIARPLGIVTASQFDKWNEDELPCILVLCAGLDGRPVRRSGGVYEASYLVGVVPIVSDVNVSESRKLASTYVAACRTAIGQHKMLRSSLHPAGFASFSKWRDEKSGEIPFPETRTLASGHVIFSIGVEGVFSEQAGPRVPTDEPSVDPGPLTPVRSVKTTVTSAPLAGALS